MRAAYVDRRQWVEVRRNLCPNPSFEAATLTPWNVNTAVAAVSTDQAKFGLRSSRVVASSSNAGAGDMRLGSTMTTFAPGFGAGVTTLISAWIHTPAAHTTFDTGAGSRQRRLIVFHSTNGTSWIQTPGPQSPNEAGWHELHHQVTLPTNAVGALLVVGCAGSSTDPGFVSYVDAVALSRSPSSYLDGDHLPTDVDPANHRVRWVGTPGLSESVLERFM